MRRPRASNIISDGGFKRCGDIKEYRYSSYRRGGVVRMTAHKTEVTKCSLCVCVCVCAGRWLGANSSVAETL